MKIKELSEEYSPNPAFELETCWIKPDGKILPVRLMGHSEAFRVWLEKYHPEQYLDLLSTLRKKCGNIDFKSKIGLKTLLGMETPIADYARSKGFIRYMIDKTFSKYNPANSAGYDYISTFHYSFLTSITSKSCLRLLYNTKKYLPMGVEVGADLDVDSYALISYGEAINFFKKAKNI
jgi:hypothetical protein